MRAKSGYGAEVKELIEEHRMQRRLLVHLIIGNSSSKATDPERVACEARLAAIKARLLEITTGGLDLRFST